MEKPKPLNKEASIFHDSSSPCWQNFKKGLRKKSQKYLSVLNSEEQNNIVFRAQR